MKKRIDMGASSMAGIGADAWNRANKEEGIHTTLHHTGKHHIVHRRGQQASTQAPADVASGENRPDKDEGSHPAI